MQPHTKIYMDFFGYTIADWCPCEIPGCGQAMVDVCHIDARGMGGNPNKDKDDIKNLMGKCRAHHEFYGDKKEHKFQLKIWHWEFMLAHGVQKLKDKEMEPKERNFIWKTENPDNEVMYSGKHKFKKLIDLPIDYLLWYKENVPRNMANQYIFDFIEQNLEEINRLKSINQ